jgi:hypothetical protein
MKQRLFFLVLCALTLAAGTAHAFDSWPAWDYSTPIDRWASNQLWNQQRQGKASSPSSPQPLCAGYASCPQRGASPKTSRAQASPHNASAASLSTGQTFATKKGIHQLVASVPSDQQPEAAKMFTSLILTFEQTIPRTYGIPANNLASAYAAVLAGSYAAYTNRPFPEDAVKPLFEQIQQGMLNNPQLAQADMDEKATIYQVWVGTGMYLLGWQDHLTKHPDAQQQAKMQKAGADALRAALGGADPARVRFTSSGMQLH